MSHEIEEQIKSILFSKDRKDNQIGIIQTISKHSSFLQNKAGTLKEFKLLQNFSGPYHRDDLKFLVETDERLIMDDIIKMGLVRNKRRDIKKELRQNSDPKYDEPGVITFYHGHQAINISITQRELIEANLNPATLNWKSLEQIKQEETKISSKDIAIATKSCISQKLLNAVRNTFEKLRKVTNKFKEFQER